MMNKKEQEYREMFIGEAQENHEEINRLLTILEKHPNDKEAVNAIFRIIHTLKGNASAMGFGDIAALAHAVEDLFSVLRDRNDAFTATTFESVFKAVDVLGNLIASINSGKRVSFKGVKAKIEVLTKRLSENGGDAANELVDTPEMPVEEQKDQISEINEVIKADKEQKNTSVEAEDKKVQEDVEEEETEGQSSNTNKVAFTDLVQIPVRKLDNLLDLVGELIIERDRIIATHAVHTSTSEYSRLTRITSDLQYSVMDVRLVQVGFLFNKFFRVVRDISASEGKIVNLKLEGTETEIDRNILQIISDSLVHLIRNAIGHGLETTEERKKAGKNETGELLLRATNDNDSVIIEIIDDGRGFDYKGIRQKAIERGMMDEKMSAQLSDDEVVMFIFEPGFSTSKEVSSISGRGVGMDVVKSALDSVGGNITATSRPGKGTNITLRLPSSMAVKATLLFELNKDQYAIPLAYTESVVSIYKNAIHHVGNNLVASHLGKTINIIFLKDLFEAERSGDLHRTLTHGTFTKLHPEAKLDIIVVSYNNRTIGLVVDRLLQRKEIVEKPLRKPVDKVRFVSGVTIMGNGNVCLVINVAYVSSYLFTNKITANAGILA